MMSLRQNGTSAGILPYKQEATRRREAIQNYKSNAQRAEQQLKIASDAAVRLLDEKNAELLRNKCD